MAYSEDESIAWVVITVTAITMSIAMLALACRVFTRAVLVKQFGVDDWVAVIAGVLLLACGITVCMNIKYGLGKHATTMDPEEIGNYLKFFYISITFYNATLVVVKMAFLLQYYRVFAVPKIQRILIVIMTLVGGWSLSQLFVGIWICHPVARFWNSTLPGSCIPNIPQWYINAAGNIMTDVTIFLFPIPILKNINMKRSQKIIVMAIFSLGFFTVAISIIRIKYLRQYADFSWENVASSCWSVGELSSAVTCLCLPTLKPLLTRIRPQFGSLSTLRSMNASSRGYWKQSKQSSGQSDGTHSTGGGSERERQRHGHGTVKSSDSQDQLYSEEAGLELSPSHGIEQTSSADGDVPRDACYTPSSATTTDGVAAPQTVLQRQMLGLRSTVTTKCAVVPSPPVVEDSDEKTRGQIQVKRDVQTHSMPRK